MKFAGLSFPTGILLFGDNYRVTVREPLPLRGIKIRRGDAKITIEKTKGSNPIYLPIAILSVFDLMIIAYCLLASISFPVKVLHQASLIDNILTGVFICGIVAFFYTIRGYHGAEHKVIAAAENGEVDVARAYSPIHPRCGTNLAPLYFLLILITSKLFFPLCGVSMGISYIAMKHASPIQRMFGAIGGVFQRLTTAEPSERELNNAIRGMRALMDAERRLAVAK